MANPNRLAVATKWLAGRLHQHAGDAVTYHGRDGLPGTTLTATRGETTYREDPIERRGAAITRSADFIFDCDAFRTAVGRWPVDGDKIAAPPSNSISGVELAWYRVTGIDGAPCYHVESHAALIRVHTLELWED